MRYDDRAPEKAAPGQPCNGCGYCCAAELCILAGVVFRGAQAPCPAMEFEAGRFHCGLVRNPESYSPVRAAIVGKDILSRTAAHLVGAGIGCDSDVPGEPPAPPEFEARMDAMREGSHMELFALSLFAWGAKPEELPS